jgi:hypothetical protein
MNVTSLLNSATFNVTYGRAGHLPPKTRYSTIYLLQPPTNSLWIPAKMGQPRGPDIISPKRLEGGRIESLRAAAKLYEIPRSMLQARAGGRVSREDKRPNGPK